MADITIIGGINIDIESEEISRKTWHEWAEASR